MSGCRPAKSPEAVRSRHGRLGLSPPSAEQRRTDSLELSLPRTATPVHVTSYIHKFALQLYFGVFREYWRGGRGVIRTYDDGGKGDKA